MTGYTRICTKDDADKIFALRSLEYQNSKDFEMTDINLLKWNEFDERGIVLAVYDDEDNAIASMAAIIVSTAKEATEILEVKIPNDVIFPALILRRGATDNKYHRLGLNSLLRYHFLETINNSKINNVLGSLYELAPRYNLLSQMGYSLINLGIHKESDFINKTPSVLAILSRSSYDYAVRLLLERTRDSNKIFPLTGKKIEYITF